MRCWMERFVRRSTRAKLNFAALTAIVLLNVFGLAEARVDADAGGKLEKSELVLAYPQASGVFTPIFVADDSKVLDDTHDFARPIL